MNLADIRKKAEESRRAAAAVSAENADESAILPDTGIPDAEDLQESTLNDFELAEEDLPEDPYSFDTQAVERYFPVSEATAAPVESLPESLPEKQPDGSAVIDTAHKGSQPETLLEVSPAKSLSGFNALETILSGRKTAADADEHAISQAHSYLSEEVEEYLCFRVAHESYAISIMAIKEIVKPRDVTEVPRMPSFILGVISLRGVIIPVMDMRLRLSLPVSPATRKERIIVLRMDTGFCGVLVDEVIQVARIKKSGIEDPPSVLDGIDRDFVTGLGHFDNRMLIILNLCTILDIGVH